MADVVYSYGADIQQILAALNQIDKTNEKVYKNAEKAANRAIKGIISDHQRLLGLTNQLDKSITNEAKAFDKLAKEAARAGKAGQQVGEGISKSAQVSGVQIGAVSGVVQEITRRFIDLGVQALKAFADITKESTQIALGFDTLQSRLIAIFKGSQPAADEAFAFIQKKSRELGIDLSELSGAFLPKVESLEQFERVAKIATALARSDPNGTGGPVGARIALQEAITGQFNSLQKRFEFDDREIKKVKEAFETSGIDGFLTAMEEVQEAGGRSFGAFADTAEGALSRVNVQIDQLKGALGVPVVEELKEQFKVLFDVISGREDDLLLIADTFGRVAANIVEIIGTGLTDFLTDLDSEQIVEIGETFFDITEDVRLLSELLLGVEFPSGFIDGVDAAATKLKEVLETTAKIIALAQAEAARKKAETQEAFKIQTETGIPFLTSDADRAKVAAAGQAAYDKVLTESVGAMQDATQATEDNAAATDKRREAIEKAKTATGGDADALLGEAAAARDAAEAAEALAGAQAKVDKAMGEAKQDFDRKLEDIDINAERKRLDILKDFADKRVDAARKNLEKIADIEEKNDRAIEDAKKDKARAFNDAATDLFRAQFKLAKEEAQKEIDVEEDFRDKLAEIRNKFELDAEEAERNRDAVGFLKAMRQRNQEIAEAQKDRQRTIDDTRIEGQRKREELQQQYQFDLIDATKAYDRKREDLRTSLARELDDQREAFAREREEISLNESRKLEEAAIARERDIEDAKLAYDRKLADLQESLAEELAIIAAGNAALEEEAKRHASEMAAAEDIRPSRTGGRAAGLGPVPGTLTGHIPADRPTHAGPRPFPVGGPGRPGGGGPRRQYGGLVNAGQGYPVGESGPELFVPSSNGRIVPNSPILMQNLGSSLGGSISNSKSQEFNFPVGDASLFNDVIFMAKLKNVILSTLDGVS